LIGERFKVGARFITVKQIKSATTVILEVEGSMNAQFEVTDRLPTEILMGVKVIALKSDRPHRATLVIDAPKDVRIERLQNVPSERFASSI
jgi:hypothetical protein